MAKIQKNLVHVLSRLIGGIKNMLKRREKVKDDLKNHVADEIISPIDNQINQIKVPLENQVKEDMVSQNIGSQGVGDTIAEKIEEFKKSINFKI